jgi:hypothetical protein
MRHRKLVAVSEILAQMAELRKRVLELEEARTREYISGRQSAENRRNRRLYGSNEGDEGRLTPQASKAVRELVEDEPEEEIPLEA